MMISNCSLRKSLGSFGCQKMAAMPTPRLCLYTIQKMSSSYPLTRNLRMLVGNPCPSSGSTKLSWKLTNPPSNLRNLHCNRKGPQRWAVLRSRCPDLGNLCHALCSTNSSCPHSSRPANLQNRLRNCKDLRVVAALVGRTVASRNLGGARCNTTFSWPLPKCSLG